MRLVLGACRMNGSPHLATRIFKSLYRDLSWVQSCIPSTWFHQYLDLSRLCTWNCSHCANSRQNILRMVARMRSLCLPRSSPWVSWWSCPLHYLLHVYLLQSSKLALLLFVFPSPLYVDFMRDINLLCGYILSDDKVPPKMHVWT